jgi:hypothetical protein
MRHKLEPRHLLADDTGNLLSLILDLRPRSSRFGSRPLGCAWWRRGEPWPVLCAASRAYPIKPGKWLKGPLRHPQHLQAVAAGLGDVGDHQEANAYRALLRRVVDGDPVAVRRLVEQMNAGGFRLYRIYRHGQPANNGARLEITRYASGAREVLFRGPVLTGNGDYPVAVSIIYPNGRHVLAHPWYRRLPRGGWRVEVEERRVIVTAADPTQGGRVVVERPGGERLWSAALDWKGARVAEDLASRVVALEEAKRVGVVE